jgi:hypothetical protein
MRPAPTSGFSVLPPVLAVKECWCVCELCNPSETPSEEDKRLGPIAKQVISELGTREEAQPTVPGSQLGSTCRN